MKLVLEGKFYLKNTIYDLVTGRAELHILIDTAVGREEWVRLGDELDRVSGRRVRVTIEVVDDAE